MAEREYVEVGDGVYMGRTGPTQEGEMATPDSRNRTWLMPDGSSKKSGGQFKNGEQVPLQETDLDRMRQK